MAMRDRLTVIEKYAAMFDAAEDEDALLETLGTPTRVAISLAGDYIPSPVGETDDEPQPEQPSPPTPWEEEAAEPPEADPEQPGELEEDAAEEPTEPAPVFLNSEAAEIPPEAAPVAEPKEQPPAQSLPKFFTEGDSAPQAEPARAYKPVLTTIFTIAAVLIGLPITLVLIAVGMPFFLLGGGAVLITVWCYVEFFAGSLGMVSDNLFCGGISLALCAVGALIAWLGIWISISLARLFIEKCILLPGRAICIKKEAVQE